MQLKSKRLLVLESLAKAIEKALSPRIFLAGEMSRKGIGEAELYIYVDVEMAYKYLDRVREAYKEYEDSTWNDECYADPNEIAIEMIGEERLKNVHWRSGSISIFLLPSNPDLDRDHRDFENEPDEEYDRKVNIYESLIQDMEKFWGEDAVRDFKGISSPARYFDWQKGEFQMPWYLKLAGLIDEKLH